MAPINLEEPKAERMPLIAPKKERGRVTLKFYDKYDFEVDLEGTVSETQVERTLASVYRSIGHHKLAAARKAQAAIKGLEKEDG